jgi:hypothetical protein
MGLSIFYSGKLQDAKQIPALTTELLDICDQYKWPCNEFLATDIDPLNGMWFAPPRSEKIWMTFLPTGVLAEPEGRMHPKDFARWMISGHEENLMNPIVQFAGPDAHMQMIRMLKYVFNKYFQDFHFVDESEYWETGNEEKCCDWFVMFGAWMDTMSADLGKLDGRGHEGGETYHARLWDLLHNGTSPKKIMDTLGDPYRNTWKDGKWINGYGIR